MADMMGFDVDVTVVTATDDETGAAVVVVTGPGVDVAVAPAAVVVVTGPGVDVAVAPPAVVPRGSALMSMTTVESPAVKTKNETYIHDVLLSEYQKIHDV